MNLEQALAQQPAQTFRSCKFGPWINTLNEDDRNAIHKAMDNPQLTTRHIYRTLMAYGCPSAESSIRSHRRGECQQCERNNRG